MRVLVWVSRLLHIFGHVYQLSLSISGNSFLGNFIVISLNDKGCIITTEGYTYTQRKK